MKQLESEVIDEIDVLVRSGFWGHDRIHEIICEELYSPGELNENLVSDAIADSIDSWRASQINWPAITDCDRLDHVFAKLNDLGVIALHNAGMTQSDGYDDVHEICVNHPISSKLIGYCFYHGQDVERAVRGGPLFFAFGPIDPKLEEFEGPKVGQIIVQQLANVGFTTQWDGTFNQRICVPNFNWQRRTVLKFK